MRATRRGRGEAGEIRRSCPVDGPDVEDSATVTLSEQAVRDSVASGSVAGFFYGDIPGMTEVDPFDLYGFELL